MGHESRAGRRPVADSGVACWEGLERVECIVDMGSGVPAGHSGGGATRDRLLALVVLASSVAGVGHEARCASETIGERGAVGRTYWARMYVMGKLPRASCKPAKSARRLVCIVARITGTSQ